MRAFRAIFVDTIQEALDQRSLQVLLFIAASLVTVVASTSVSPISHEQALRSSANQLGVFRLNTGLTRSITTSMNIDLEIRGVRAADSEDPVGPNMQDARVLELRLRRPYSMDAIITSWSNFKVKRETGEYPETGEVPSYDTLDRRQFLEERFCEFGYAEVLAWVASEDKRTYRVAARVEHPEEVRGSHEVTILFGRASIPLNDRSLAETVVSVQQSLASGMIGFMGLLVLLSVAAVAVPTMLQTGSVGLLLARPISRSRVLWLKYLSGVLLIAILSLTVFATLGHFIQRNTGVGSVWFVASALTLTVNFAVLLAVSMLTGVLTRSPTVSQLVPLTLWGLCVGVTYFHHHGEPFVAEYPALEGGIAAAYHVLPHIADFSEQNMRFLAQSLTTGTRDHILAELPEVDLLFAGLTTLTFTLGVMITACWRLRRRDF